MCLVHRVAVSKNHTRFLSEIADHTFLFLCCTELDFVGEEESGVFLFHLFVLAFSFKDLKLYNRKVFMGNSITEM